jgi:hypothetical protein
LARYRTLQIGERDTPCNNSLCSPGMVSAASD